jgi:hypothetical protein
MPLCKFLCKMWKIELCLLVSISPAIGCTIRYAQDCVYSLHQKFALTFSEALLRLLPSTVERVGKIKLASPK